MWNKPAVTVWETENCLFRDESGRVTKFTEFVPPVSSRPLKKIDQQTCKEFFADLVSTHLLELELLELTTKKERNMKIRFVTLLVE